MAGNTFGTLLRLTIFGESHGESIGGILDGVPPNIPIDITLIQNALDRRKPGQNRYVTARTEDDIIQIQSGLFEGKTLGTPICFIIKNTNQQSNDYDELKTYFRPGHGDYTYHAKYGHRDHRGGGRASARETAARVAAGAFAHIILEHTLKRPILIRSCVKQLGDHNAITNTQAIDWDFVIKNTEENPIGCPCPIALPRWIQKLNQLKEDGLSAGATLYFEAHGLPAGLGEPVFDKLDADIAKAMMGINAVKAIAMGDTFDVCAAQTGYDEMTLNEDNTVAFTSNQAGGTLAGISTGQPITGLVAFKPTSSTKTVRQGLTNNGQPISIPINGRHDPCVALRARPIIEAMLALTVCDHFLRWRGQCGNS